MNDVIADPRLMDLATACQQQGELQQLARTPLFHIGGAIS